MKEDDPNKVLRGGGEDTILTRFDRSQMELSPLGNGSDQGAWPDPVPIVATLASVLPFAADMLPAALGDYVLDIAERQQCPPDFVAVSALCGLSALIGNAIRIGPKQQDPSWTVVPNLWGAVIGRPGSMKSPAMTAALAPLYALELRLEKAWRDGMSESTLDAEIAALERKDAGKRASQALKEGDKAAVREILEAAQDQYEDKRPRPRLVVNDCTVEALGVLLNENPRGLLLVRDELPGWLAKMEDDRFRSERAFYLEAHNGDKRFTVDRIGRGTLAIANTTLAMIGGIQPSRIVPVVRAAIDGTADDGLLQRLQLAVWPDDRGAWKWVDCYPDKTKREAYEAVFERAYGLASGQGSEPLVLRFSPEAQDMFRDWMTALHATAKGEASSSAMESWLMKMPKTVASLALIFELAEREEAPFEVGVSSLRRAIRWYHYLRSHAERLYGSSLIAVDDGARLVLSRRNQLPDEFTLRDICRKMWAGLGDRAAVDAAVDRLEQANCCREREAPSPVGIGRPTKRYEWNPKLKKN